ncbi:MAG: 2-oxo-4-hydroxy-4-carboxy-5-ureidoimidazoline decarboxylase [Cyanobacteria bacterium P01_E01_bin.34]
MTYAIAELNQMDRDTFVGVLGAVFEDTPAIAERAWRHRPFANFAELHRSMVEIVDGFEATEQLALIRAHPDLGSRVTMAEASELEQAEVGLDRLSPQDYRQFQQLNQQYRDRFSFPFIIAVRGHTKSSILEAFVERLNNSVEVERQQALSEIARIAWYRLQDLGEC